MIAGIDPSSRKLAVVWGDQPVVTIYKLKPRTWADRCLGAWQAMDELVTGWPHTVVILERPVFLPRAGARSLIPQAMVSGAIQVALVSAGHEVVLVSPGEWKKSTVGRGNASKGDASEWLRSADHGLWLKCGGDQDAVDAACMWHHGRRAESG